MCIAARVVIREVVGMVAQTRQNQCDIAFLITWLVRCRIQGLHTGSKAEADGPGQVPIRCQRTDVRGRHTAPACDAGGSERQGEPAASRHQL